MKIIISACLMGDNCKYNGGNNLNEELVEMLKANDHEIIAVCPEVLGGLSTPRAPGEILDGAVVNEDGTSVDEQYRKGAELTLRLALSEKPDIVILQSRSPSCGVKTIYDGTFSGKKIEGQGLTAEALIKAGFRVVDVEDWKNVSL